MFKIKVIISIFIFSILLIITSLIKNQTRIIEKNIFLTDKRIAFLKKDLYETELDFFYLSSPDILSKKIKSFALIDYYPIDISRIYLNYKDFLNSKEKVTILKQNEKKTEKK